MTDPESVAVQDDKPSTQTTLLRDPAADWLFNLGVALSDVEPLRLECSAGAQLNILLSIADNLGLTKAADLLQPMIHARLGKTGVFIPDEEFGHA